MYEHRFQFQQPNADLRVGDSEREQTGDRLRRAHAEGRLDAEEFQERIEGCYEAKTAGQLHELVTDLPGEERQPRSGRPFWLMPRWRAVLAALLALVLVGAVIHGHVLWVLLPLFFLTRFWGWRRRPYFRL